MEGLEVALAPHSHFSGKELVTWLQLAAEKAEKCGLVGALEEGGDGLW